MDDKNVIDSEVALTIEKMTNLIKLEIAAKIPDTEVFINAKQGLTLIKEGTYTSAWVLFVNENFQHLRDYFY